jgi:hypothetical protein
VPTRSNDQFMSEQHRILLNKVGERSEGAGDISPALIDKRAEELALSDGRTAEETTDADYARASRELLHPVPAEQDGPDPEQGFRRPDAALATPGTKASTEYDEDGQIGAALVEEGVQEAVHDAFVQAGRETLADLDIQGEAASDADPEPGPTTDSEPAPSLVPESASAGGPTAARLQPRAPSRNTAPKQAMRKPVAKPARKAPATKVAAKKKPARAKAKTKAAAKKQPQPKKAAPAKSRLRVPARRGKKTASLAGKPKAKGKALIKTRLKLKPKAVKAKAKPRPRAKPRKTAKRKR